MRNDYNDREEMNAIQRDRLERRRNTRRKSMISTAVFAVVIIAILAGIIIGVVALTGGNKKNAAPTEPATIAATIAATTQQATQPAAAPTTNHNGAVNNQQQNTPNAVQTPTQSQWQDDNPAHWQEATTAPQSGNEAPASSAVSDGSALHYYASGQTSYGYDWTYSGGGGIVSVTCNYNFDTNQYDFTIGGLSEGTTDLTLYYNTDDGVQVPVSMLLSVDSDLNVTQIG